jgi:hypothetical protein
MLSHHLMRKIAAPEARPSASREMLLISRESGKPADGQLPWCQTAVNNDPDISLRGGAVRRGRPGRRCSICAHAHRGAIDSALMTGRHQASIADEHAVSRDALSRHYLRHISHAMADQPPIQDADHPERVDLTADVMGLRKRLFGMLMRAEKDRDYRAAVAIAREALRAVEVLGKLRGEIDGSGVRVAIVNSVNPANTEAIRERILAKLAALSGPVRLIGAI